MLACLQGLATGISIMVPVTRLVFSRYLVSLMQTPAKVTTYAVPINLVILMHFVSWNMVYLHAALAKIDKVLDVAGTSTEGHMADNNSTPVGRQPNQQLSLFMSTRS